MILYNMEFINRSDVHISIDDRGYYFGDGIYEVFRVYNGRMFEVELHMLRLERTARETRIALPCLTDVLELKLQKLIELEQFENGTLYMQITRGAAPRAHPFPVGAEPVFMAYCSQMKRPYETMQSGITAMTSADIRWLRCDLKTLNLMPNIMAKQEALDGGYDEVIMHRNETVTECSASNVMMVRNGVIVTHPANNFILHGVTREVVRRLAKGLDIELSETEFTLQQLRGADEVFICGTTVEITPVISIDGQSIGSGQPGSITRKLQEAFETLISGSLSL